MRIYIKAANQISLQMPLNEEWINNPIFVEDPYCRSIDPDFKQFIPPVEARRLGKVLKRAISVSIKTLKDSGIECPNAIITGTGLGSVESTEAFLTNMCENGEQQLSPTHFMQSTHNTISSAIAIKMKCHGYNSTYSHKDVSFQSALYDAYLQLKNGKISNCLVEGHDGITPAYFHLLELSDYVGNGMKGTCSEVAMAALLTSDESEDSLCELNSCKVLYKQSEDRICQEIIKALKICQSSSEESLLMIGVNGKDANDKAYNFVLKDTTKYADVLKYKNIFGECFTANALGLYSAAHILKQGRYPLAMKCFERSNTPADFNTIILLDISRNGDTSIITLKKK